MFARSNTVMSLTKTFVLCHIPYDNVFSRRFRETEIHNKAFFKDIVQPKKRGGQEGYQSIRLHFVHIRVFIDALKGIFFCFKFQETYFSV
jgi:hypothetical protein